MTYILLKKFSILAMSFQEWRKAYSYPVPLPPVLGEAKAQVAVDNQGIVDINEKGQLLLMTQREQLHTLQVHSQLTITLIICAFRHGFIVHWLQQKERKKRTPHNTQQINATPNPLYFKKVKVMLSKWSNVTRLH